MRETRDRTDSGGGCVGCLLLILIVAMVCGLFGLAMKFAVDSWRWLF